MGADSNAQTVATFLRFYTPDIVGGSLGHHFGEVRTEYIYYYIATLQERKKIFFNEQKVGMLLQKGTDTRGVGISTQPFEFARTSNQKKDLEVVSPVQVC